MKKKNGLLTILALLLSGLLLTGCTEQEIEMAQREAVRLIESQLQTGEYAEDTITEADVQEDTIAEADAQEDTEAEIVSEDTQEVPEQVEEVSEAATVVVSVNEYGRYTSKEEVAAYINEYQHLPYNYITKKEAKDLGWESTKGNLWEVAPERIIGGDRFGNYEEQLPMVKGRKYYECDIDYDGKHRNSKRIVYSNDGLIYYTEDHYETFELLYGEVEETDD